MGLLPWTSVSADTTPAHSSQTSPFPSAPSLVEASPGTTLTQLLHHFSTPGAIPPFARVDPEIKQKQSASLLTFGTLWRYGAFFAVKCKHPFPYSPTSRAFDLIFSPQTQQRNSQQLSSHTMYSVHGKQVGVLRYADTVHRITKMCFTHPTPLDDHRV